MVSPIFKPAALRILGSLAAAFALISFSGCASTSGNSTIPTATITWPTPAAIPYGTPLTAAQLNATANAAGTFDYYPGIGTTTPTILSAGTHTLTAYFIPAAGTNYVSSIATVTLTVTGATPTITWPAPAGITAGVPLSATQLDATASTPGTFTYTPAAGTVLAAGTQTLSVTFTPTDTVDFSSATATTTLTVGNPSYTYNNVRIVAGGFITGIIQHPTTQNLRYVRTDIGGAYRWDPVNLVWVPLLDFLSSAQDNYLGVESIALDPTNPQKLYMALGTYAAESFSSNGAFAISSDQGNTFTIVPASIKMGSNDSGRHAGERLAVDPNLPSTLYFGSRLNGLWRSTNSGANWSQVTSFPVTATTNGVGITFVDFVTTSGSSGSATPVIYVGVSDSGLTTPTYASLYRSTDGGNTWAAVTGAPTGLYVTHGVLGADNLGTNGAIYLSYGNAPGPTGITGGALWKYTLPPNTTPTAAGTWANISVAPPARAASSQGGYGAIAIDPEVPGVVMASTMDDYNNGDDIFRSTNFGTTWVSLLAQGVKHDYTLAPWMSFHNPGVSIGTGNWPGCLVVDPFNSNHVMYGTGQTLWDSTNIQLSDSGKATSFSIGALGIEEASISALVSPTAAATLLSGMGDIDGMAHSTLTASPASGMIGTSAISKTVSIDYAQTLPVNVVLVGVGGGSYATDGGVTATSWTNFNLPTGSTAAQGTVAIDASAANILWSTSDGIVAYSTNKGVSWTNSTGAIANGQVFADRVTPLLFYNLAGNTLQTSKDGGKTFTTTTTTIPNNAQMAVSSAAVGDLWIAAGATFEHSTNGGSSWTAITGLSNVSYVALGKAATGMPYPALYTIATGPAGAGFYRSIDQGVTWVRINDSAHQYAYTPMIAADPKTFGQFYIGTNGRGIIYGTSPY